MFDESLLWKNKEGSPLMVIYPGGTGSRRPSFRGLDAIAAFFWMRGYSCYLGLVGGQDGLPGEFSIEHALAESRETLNELKDSLKPKSVCLFGTCSGGTVAASLASEPSQADVLVLYETLPEYDDDDKRYLISLALVAGIHLSPDFYSEYIDTAKVAPGVFCPVLLLYGDKSYPPAPPIVTSKDMEKLKASFTSASKLEMQLVKDADHYVTLGSSVNPLNDLLLRVEEFIKPYTGINH